MPTTAAELALVPPLDVDELHALVVLLGGRRTLALTGAGISTESGIPDYRGPGTRRRARQPMRFATFVDEEAARRRYWARSFVGFPRVAHARPNAAHQALVDLERSGAITAVVTQNVDGLHQVAGSQRVVELHGALDRVVCLACGETEPRASLQDRLAAANPLFAGSAAPTAPDGDVDLDPASEASFVDVGCRHCGGHLKPDVVFFGENLAPQVLTAADELLAEAGALLVVGTSLEVYSARRLLREAHLRGLPVAVVSLGAVREAERATLVVAARAGEALPRLAQALCTPSRPPPLSSV